jgi:hypothetical protein
MIKPLLDCHAWFEMICTDRYPWTDFSTGKLCRINGQAAWTDIRLWARDRTSQVIPLATATAAIPTKIQPMVSANVHLLEEIKSGRPLTMVCASARASNAIASIDSTVQTLDNHGLLAAAPHTSRPKTAIQMRGGETSVPELKMTLKTVM